MSYKGRQLSSGNYLKLDDLQSFFNGTQKTFNLTSGGSSFYPGSAFSILVVLGGVIQEPEGAYTIDQSQITFAAAPGASDDFFCIALGVALGVGVPADGTVTPAKLTKPFNYNDGHLTLDTTNDRVGINSSTPGYTLDVRGDTRIVGILTVGTSSIVLDGSNNTLRVGSGVTITSTEINASSFVGSFTGNATGLSGTPNIAVGSINASSAIISGNVSIAGTVTYEDVTNVDSVGVVTARSGIHVTGGSIGIGTNNPTSKLQVIGSTDLSKLNLSGISSSISDTATDVFVYDTRKDSDGGAWRKRTQHTSWYNETLNTATRGSRRDFPAVAVIVATLTTVTIYDGDDPDMPMWMVIPSNTVDWASNPGDATSLFCLNGILSIGTIGAGTVIFEFISDRRMIAYATPGYQFLDKSISARGIGSYTSAGGYIIVSSSCNDVAMTVLPNAPIDPSTGLPVPTIAVATNGGTSIIRDDGTVTNAGGTTTTKISINEKGIVYFASTANGGYYGYSLVGGSLDSFFNTIGNLRILSNTNSNTNNNLVVPNAFNLYSGQTIGLTIVNKDFLNTYNDYNGMVAYATTSYNTGWMHGDIKGAFLSDTSTASVTGTELITNGTFSTSDLSAWTTIAGGTAVITGGLLKLTDTSNAFVYASAPFSTVVGKKYVVTFDIVNNGDNTANYNYVRIGNSHNSTEHHDTNYGTSYGKYQVTITASATTTYITLINGLSNGLFGYWDNVSARLAEPDRSVNNKGLAVYGTITKTAVATGSNLVAYSGFSDGDYLKQPHNSSLEFGTGSFSCTVWFKSSTADVSNYKGLVYLNRNGSIGEGFQILLTPSNGIYFYIYGPTNDFSGTSHTGYNDGNWHQISVSSTGTHQRVYLDGVLKETGNITTGSITDTSSELFIGKWYGAGDPFYWRGSIALCRISASIPSPEQILKIYNDEKALFQPNSQCTLYGSSDAVTALAYDDTTKLLSVGTSSGRSDFQGLERINNTTTAVTTAISASNGLIAEQ